MNQSSYNVVAVMSGTSLDGIDIIGVTFRYTTHWSFEIAHTTTVTYPAHWKEKLKHLTRLDENDLKDLDVSYTRFLAKTIKAFITTYKLSDIDFIASHGHTAKHQPESRFTYQIGNLQVLADDLQEKVICDFRVQDVALGGQGAPLVPIGDRLLFSNYDYCLNLGGFANLSYESLNGRIAFDICPVNIVLNHYVSELGLDYDDGGKIAASGTVDVKLLTALNTLSFYTLSPPKSLGLEWVESTIFPLIDTYKLPVASVLSTMVKHIANQIGAAISNTKSTVLVTGGGTYNTYLISQIKEATNASIVIPDANIIEFKEALIFGLLGALKARNMPNCLSSVTGAKFDHSSGKILIPKSKI